MIGLEPIIQRLATERAPSKRREARQPATSQNSGDKPDFWAAGGDRLGARLAILCCDPSTRNCSLKKDAVPESPARVSRSLPIYALSGSVLYTRNGNIYVPMCDFMYSLIYINISGPA